MDNVLSWGTECFVENGRNEEGAKILGILKRTVPVLLIREGEEEQLCCLAGPQERYQKLEHNVDTLIKINSPEQPNGQDHQCDSSLIPQHQ